MALKLALPGLDARAMARFKAWWNGEETSAPSEDSAPTPDADSELFDAAAPPLDPRIAALEIFWGAGRIAPADEAAEALDLTRIDAAGDEPVALFGPGLEAGPTALASARTGPIAIFEWRDEVIASARARIAASDFAARISYEAVDLEMMHPEAQAFGGVISAEELTFVDNVPRFAQQITRMLRPGGVAVLQAYCGAPSSDLSAAFASAFAEPHVRMNGDLADVFQAAGLRVDSDENITEEHLELAKAGFRRLAGVLTDASSLNARTAQELAWEAEAWRARSRLLAAGRLERRRFTLTRTD